MTNKQIALEIINFGKPEKVLCSIPHSRVAYLGCDLQGFDGSGDHLPVGSKWQDIWGVGWQKEQEGVMAFPVFHPLADLSALKSYKWPDPDDERIIASIYSSVQNADRNDKFLSGSHRSTIWERLYKLVGMENAMMRFYEEPEAMKEILHKIMDFQLGIQKHYLANGIEMTQTGDDLGTQHGPLLSPDIIREFLLPEYKRLFSVYNQNGVIINHHSCGCIESLIDIFIEMGIQVLNPIQANANNLTDLRRKTQGKIALCGGIGSGLIVSGPVEKIRQEVKEKIHLLGKEGGYFCEQDQGMPWPEEHYKAMVDAVEEFGHYPL